MRERKLEGIAVKTSGSQDGLEHFGNLQSPGYPIGESLDK
jgi:hypothetical protein